MSLKPEFKPNTVGLYCIVRDAEKTLQALLNSVYQKDNPKVFFDEYIFVDTGSIDNTKKMIEEHFGVGNVWLGIDTPVEKTLEINHAPSGSSFRLVLAQFKWVYDFSKARNYSFDLGTCEWRGYLDSDDVFEFGKYIKPSILDAANRISHLNAISIEYDYAPGIVAQDTIRWVRWHTGFRWVSPIHEYMQKIGPKHVSKFGAMKVLHRPTNDGPSRSLDRNIKMCSDERVKALAAGDKVMAAKMSFYMGMYYSPIIEDRPKALQAFQECIDILPDLNIASMAALEAFKITVGNFEESSRWALQVIKHAPELPEGYYALGIAYAKDNSFKRASDLFLTGMKIPYPEWNTNKDIHFMEAVAPAIGAYSLMVCGKVSEALELFSIIPQEKKAHPDIVKYVDDYTKLVMRHEGEMRLRNYWEYLIWAAEPVKAKELLDRCLPDNLKDSGSHYELRSVVADKLGHFQNFDKYKARYGAVPLASEDDAKPGIRENIQKLSRMQALKNWTLALPKEGEHIKVLSIGPWSAIGEEQMLELNNRIHIRFCEIAPHASPRIQTISDRFPGRVTYVSPSGPFDFGVTYPDDLNHFDLIIAYEIIEHIDDPNFMRELHRALKFNGEMLVSTPNAENWVEPKDPMPKRPDYWWAHVRAYNPFSLYEQLKDDMIIFKESGELDVDNSCNFDGNVYTTDFGKILLAHFTKKKITEDYLLRNNKLQIDILVANAPKPFDAESTKYEFLGGSEECVVHLSNALAKQGYRVTVYNDTLVRNDGWCLKVKEGAYWKEIWQFHPAAYEKSHLFTSEIRNRKLLIWRNPSFAVDFSDDARKNIFHWLHDGFYGVPAYAYERAAKTIVLSKHHQNSVAEYDQAKVNNFCVLSNGLEAEAFPSWNVEERDPHKVIYSSSPDRGLEYLLDMWLDVKSAVPQASLDIYYNWQAFRIKRPEDYARLIEKVKRLESNGVTLKGGVHHEKLHSAMRKAGVLAYPHESIVETFCITVIKAVACGMKVVATNAGALPEVLDSTGASLVRLSGGDSLDKRLTKDDLEYFKDLLIMKLQQPRDENRLLKAREMILEKYNWDRVALNFVEAVK